MPTLFHTLTYDNGKEFAYHQAVAKGLDAQGYFAHPYHSWERGLNENTNGLIRQYLPKGTDFRTLTLEKCPQHHRPTQQPATEISWLQDPESAILRHQPTCCTYELNPRNKKIPAPQVSAEEAEKPTIFGNRGRISLLESHHLRPIARLADGLDDLLRSHPLRIEPDGSLSEADLGCLYAFQT